jgi:hypothetical protein
MSASRISWGSRPSTDSTVTVHVDIAFSRHGSRKQIVFPDGSTATAQPPPPNASHNALLKALARAFRWRELIETGTHATVDDLAKGEKINPSYASRILRLTLLAPEVVELILDRRTAPETTLASLLKPLPVEWAAQARRDVAFRSSRQTKPVR